MDKIILNIINYGSQLSHTVTHSHHDLKFKILYEEIKNKFTITDEKICCNNCCK